MKTEADIRAEHNFLFPNKTYQESQALYEAELARAQQGLSMDEIKVYLGLEGPVTFRGQIEAAFSLADNQLVIEQRRLSGLSQRYAQSEANPENESYYIYNLILNQRMYIQYFARPMLALAQAQALELIKREAQPAQP